MPRSRMHRHRARVVGRLHAVADAVRLQLLDRPRRSPRPGPDSPVWTVMPRPYRRAARNSRRYSAERKPGDLGPGDVDADDAAPALGDRLLRDDLVELDTGRRGPGRAAGPGFTGYSRRRPVHAADGRAMMWSRSCSPPAVPLHGVEAELHGGDVVLAVRAADDLVDRALHRDRAGLDELGPVEQLQVAVEALRALRVDRDEVAELPVVAWWAAGCPGRGRCTT